MSEDRQLLLEKLRAELAFIESGGYPNPVRGQWRPQFIFEDSAMCLNHDPTQESMPYTERVLARFVPDVWTHNRAPCRQIRLNEGGETIGELCPAGTQYELGRPSSIGCRRRSRKLQTK